MNQHYSIQDLLDIMRSLRDPHTGCSWDQVQTFQTIAPYTIEEAYEVAEAISRLDMSDLCDELGDLLLQVVYHSQIAIEQQAFDFDDVVKAVCEKMIRRHPHVFGDEQQVEQGKQDWEMFKQQERKAKGLVNDRSALANVTLGLPPLIRARKLQKKAAKVNFDWSETNGAVTKLKEEVAELEQAIMDDHPDAHIEEEIGDVLFSIVNVCRHAKVDADVALQKGNAKFEQRFRLMEIYIQENGEKLECLSVDDMEKYWLQAKNELTK